MRKICKIFINGLVEYGILCEKLEFSSEQTAASSKGDQEEQGEWLQKKKEVTEEKAQG